MALQVALSMKFVKQDNKDKHLLRIIARISHTLCTHLDFKIDLIYYYFSQVLFM